jgi:small subunit ribosomal protein S20
MSVFVSDHGEDEHGEGEHEIAELLQAAILGSRAPKVKRAGEPSQSGFLLDLARSVPYVFGLSFRTRSGSTQPFAEVAVPRIKSAAKRMRQGRTRTVLNRTHRSELRTALKKVRSATGAEAKAAYDEAVKLLDRAGRKSIIHKNAAARQKSRLAKLVASKK